MCDYLKYTEIIERICHLINRKATGTPKELAKSLDISERLAFLFWGYTPGYAIFN